jgi:hypothetical protein
VQGNIAAKTGDDRLLLSSDMDLIAKIAAVQQIESRQATY